MPVLSYAAASLLAGTLIGGFYLILLFGLCFGGVVGAKFLNRRAREAKRREQHGDATENRREKAEEPSLTAVQEKKKSAPKTKNVYYIVEKKRSRPKSEYSEPKEIRFEK